MVSAVLFDFDLTLADSTEGAVDCLNFALQSIGRPYRKWDDCCATIGLSLDASYRTLTGRADAQESAAFSRYFLERADEVMAAKTSLYDGVPEFIRQLFSNEFVLGIVSTKYQYRMRQILDRYGLTDFFATIVGGEDVAEHKPHPEGVYRFLSATSVSASQTVLIGDTVTDAEAASRARVEFVAVLTGMTTRDQFSLYNPVAILNSVTEFTPNADP